MAEHDRFTQRGDGRGGAGGQPAGRAGAYDGPRAPQRGGRSEFGGYGGTGDIGRGGWGPGGSGSGGVGAAAPDRDGGRRDRIVHARQQGGYGRQVDEYGRQRDEYGRQRDDGGARHGGYGGQGDVSDVQGASPYQDDDDRPWGEARAYGAGPGRDARGWHAGETAGSYPERWESGRGAGWSGPGGQGWRTDTGHGVGGSGLAGGVSGDTRSRPGGGGPGIGAMRNRGPKGWQRSDERIHDDVCERLAAEPGIDPSEVSVEVRSGDVVLTGSVPDRGMKYRIEDVVDGCSGVRDVDNRLRVDRGGFAGLLGGAAGGAGTTTDARGGEREGSRGSLLGRLFGFSGGARLSDIMTREPHTVGPDETLVRAAQAMKAQDVGAIPVCTGRTLTGMVTDRDIVVRAAAAGKPLDTTRVSEVMTTEVHACYEDEDVETALDRMGDLQVRRIPVLDRADRLVGIVSLGDFARRDTGDVEDALQDISRPA